MHDHGRHRLETTERRSPLSLLSMCNQEELRGPLAWFKSARSTARPTQEAHNVSLGPVSSEDRTSLVCSFLNELWLGPLLLHCVTLRGCRSCRLDRTHDANFRSTASTRRCWNHRIHQGPSRPSIRRLTTSCGLVRANLAMIPRDTLGRSRAGAVQAQLDCSRVYSSKR